MNILGPLWGLLSILCWSTNVFAVTGLTEAEQVLNARISPTWIDDETLEFRRASPDGAERFEISVLDGRVRSVEPGNRASAGRLEPEWVRRSRDRDGGRVDLRVTNDLNDSVALVWLDRAGTRQPYHTVAPGTTYTQSTFAGHAWSILDASGDEIARFVAPARDAEITIDAKTSAMWDSLVSSRRRGRDATPTDRRPVVSVREHDLWVEGGDGSKRRLTDDGTAASSWGRIVPSPDGRFVLAMKTDAPESHPVHMVEVDPADSVEPRLKTIQYLKPGDRIAHPHPAVFDLASGRRIDLDPGLAPDPWSIDRVSWHPDGDRVRFLYNRRGHQLLRLIEIDAVTGASRVLLEETSPTFIDYAGKLFLHVMDDGDRAIWMSERSGWNHLEMIDLESGSRRPITSGPWVVRAVDEVDEEAGTIRIRILGIDPAQDPYHVHHAIVDLDSGRLTRLTEGDGTHTLEFSPDGRHYVDRWSRVDLPPVHELRRTSDGGLIAELARADASRLEEGGWTRPIRFVAKARDGETDIWGVIVLPRGFDASKSYPVIEHIYAGPHGHFVPKAWARHWRMREIADLGAVVVQIDGMGTNWRSKAFHDVAWRNLGDSGFPDRIAWMRAAADDRPWMDLDRVGIYGGSAGGQSALRALLAHGDFYDVAVADCGCHDNRMDKIWWNELWMGWPIGPHYEEQSNVANAHHLEGALMLVLGGLDTNVDPASTLQVVDALVKADKDFEFVLLPSAGHGAAESPYGHRRRMEFLERKLIEPAHDRSTRRD
ncbi:MAG: prolyl oligopeptidase family serine peptidase [Planctomycetota bacterium]|nr:prolyl oligopeptidase family serine peptidase [Planctomycetota bacterium]